MKIAIIGAGNMGGSIARGLAKGSLIADSDIIVSNPSAGKLEKLKEEFPGISTTQNNAEAAAGADIVGKETVTGHLLRLVPGEIQQSGTFVVAADCVEQLFQVEFSL